MGAAGSRVNVEVASASQSQSERAELSLPRRIPPHALLCILDALAHDRQYISLLEDFLTRYCMMFADGEQALICTEIHSQYRKLFENCLERVLNRVRVSVESFAECMEEALAHGVAEAETILDFAAAADDYIAFSALMSTRLRQLHDLAVGGLSKREAASQAEELRAHMWGLQRKLRHAEREEQAAREPAKASADVETQTATLNSTAGKSFKPPAAFSQPTTESVPTDGLSHWLAATSSSLALSPWLSFDAKIGDMINAQAGRVHDGSAALSAAHASGVATSASTTSVPPSHAATGLCAADEADEAGSKRTNGAVGATSSDGGHAAVENNMASQVWQQLVSDSPNSIAWGEVAAENRAEKLSTAAAEGGGRGSCACAAGASMANQVPLTNEMGELMLVAAQVRAALEASELSRRKQLSQQSAASHDVPPTPDNSCNSSISAETAAVPAAAPRQGEGGGVLGAQRASQACVGGGGSLPAPRLSPSGVPSGPVLPKRSGGLHEWTAAPSSGKASGRKAAQLCNATCTSDMLRSTGSALGCSGESDDQAARAHETAAASCASMLQSGSVGAGGEAERGASSCAWTMHAAGLTLSQDADGSLDAQAGSDACENLLGVAGRGGDGEGLGGYSGVSNKGCGGGVTTSGEVGVSGGTSLAEGPRTDTEQKRAPGASGGANRNRLPPLSKLPPLCAARGKASDAAGMPHGASCPDAAVPLFGNAGIEAHGARTPFPAETASLSPQSASHAARAEAAAKRGRKQPKGAGRNAGGSTGTPDGAGDPAPSPPSSDSQAAGEASDALSQTPFLGGTQTGCAVSMVRDETSWHASNDTSPPATSAESESASAILQYPGGGPARYRPSVSLPRAPIAESAAMHKTGNSTDLEQTLRHGADTDVDGKTDAAAAAHPGGWLKGARSRQANGTAGTSAEDAADGTSPLCSMSHVTSDGFVCTYDEMEIERRKMRARREAERLQAAAQEEASVRSAIGHADPLTLILDDALERARGAAPRQGVHAGPRTPAEEEKPQAASKTPEMDDLTESLECIYREIINS